MRTKYNVIFLPLLFFLFSTCNYSDKNPDFLLETVFINNDERLLNYDAVSDAERKPFFIEEFDDTISQFPYPVGTYTDREVSIADGKMTIKFFVNRTYLYSKPVPIEIDKSRNFEMETSLVIHRNDSVWYTFAWLPNRATGSGYYTIDYDQFEDSKNKMIETIELRNRTDNRERINGYDFNAEYFLNSNEFTVLTIRKIGNKYAIFINHKLFYIINDKNFSYIPAITTCVRVINVFDYFRVYYLP